MNIFSEIYGAYFRIAAKLLENKRTDEKTVREIIMSEGFRDSILFLPQKLLPGSEDWGFFRRANDGGLERITRSAPVKVLTALQKRWLRAKLSDPRIRLFMNDETIARLEESLSAVQPLYRPEHFRFTDIFSDHDDYTDENYITNFRKVLDAVKYRRIVDISYVSGNGRQVRGRFVPLKLEYSQKNDKFRVYCYLLRHDKVRSGGIINVGRIETITDTGRRFRSEVSIERYFSSRKCAAPAVIRVTTARNGVERFMMEFASYEKHTVRDLESGEYTVELWYDEQDETELLIRLLSFGPVIEIIGPEKLRQQARERVKKQYELLIAEEMLYPKEPCTSSDNKKSAES